MCDGNVAWLSSCVSLCAIGKILSARWRASMRICRAARFLSRRSRGMPRYDECCNHEHIMRTLTCARAFRVSTLGILLRFERNDSFGACTTSLRWSPRSLPPSACPPPPAFAACEHEAAVLDTASSPYFSRRLGGGACGRAGNQRWQRLSRWRSRNAHPRHQASGTMITKTRSPARPCLQRKYFQFVPGTTVSDSFYCMSFSIPS